MDEQNQACEVVNLKIPPLWVDKPDLWFASLDAQFQVAKVKNESTKFYHLLSAIEPKYLDSIADIIRDGNSTTKYTDAKAKLLTLLKESEGRQLKTLLHGMELGQQKPSFLLQKMQSLAGENVGEKLIRQLWLEKLPESVRNVIVVSDEKLFKLAEMADKIVDLSPVVEVYSASTGNNNQHLRYCYPNL